MHAYEIQVHVSFNKQLSDRQRRSHRLGTDKKLRSINEDERSLLGDDNVFDDNRMKRFKERTPIFGQLVLGLIKIGRLL
jgi:hypothetical protein